MESNQVCFAFHDHSKDTSEFITDAFGYAQSIHILAQHPPPNSEGSGALWFRGQADASWPLIPPIGRKRDFWGNLENPPVPHSNEVGRFLELEKVLLSRFRRHAYPFFGRVLTPWEAITVARHHNLPTRLLDWTSNPFVALYFAAEQHRDKDGAVFAYRPRKNWSWHISTFEGENPDNPQVEDPLAVRGVKIVFPMMAADRLVAQNGGFTIQYPFRCLTEQPSEVFTEEDFDIAEIHKWVLPSGKKGETKLHILDQLHRCGINHRTLFPDLDGLGLGLIRAEAFRKHPGGFCGK